MNELDKLFITYYSKVPLALVLERLLEVQIFEKIDLNSPSLDLGCGDGIFSSLAFKKQFDIGVDYNEKELRLASETKKYSELIATDAKSIPINNLYFRTIVCNSVLEHMDNFEEILLECYRVLNFDGDLYFTLPTRLFERYAMVYSLFNKVGLKYLAEKVAKFYNFFWRHKNVYDTEQWENKFRSAGFQVIETFRYNTKSQTKLNDFLTWFAAIGWIFKKLINRWTVLSEPRILLGRVLIPIFRKQMKLKKTQEGSLIFFHLRKKSSD
jgi:ubiquinone/menaquinone biosynthesis C-methylase UbiE